MKIKLANRAQLDKVTPMTTNTASFICSYSCRYSHSSCNGSFIVQAATPEEARKLARQHLSQNGGLEGIDYSIRKA